MIQFIEGVLKKLGIISPIEKDEIINAQIENKAREYDDAVIRLHESLERRATSMRHLRESLRVANSRTNSFVEFERLTKEAGKHREERH